MVPLALLWRYFYTRKLHSTDREALENWQAKRLHQFRQDVLSHNSWFQRYLTLPFNQQPMIDKALMMTYFDEMNTVGLKRDELFDCAMRNKQSRDFKPRIGRFSVRLSLDTSGHRGLFVVSLHEQQIWAVGVLTKVLPDGLFAKEWVALFLYADNNLYQSANNRRLSLDSYDLLAPSQTQLKLLQQRAPMIIVASAQVLRALALEVMTGELTLRVKKVISAAEALEPQDRESLRNMLHSVGGIYQAIEDSLVSTYRYGMLHLNEEFVYVEPQRLDEHRFVPTVADSTRTTQPIVRYRLDDMPVASRQSCSCGSATMAIACIEGRQDDQLQLPTRSSDIQTVFADACGRVLIMILSLTVDYRLLQTGSIQLMLIADRELWMLEHCREALNALFMRQDIAAGQLIWSLGSQTAPASLTAKRRRVVRQWGWE